MGFVYSTSSAYSRSLPVGRGHGLRMMKETFEFILFLSTRK